MNSSPVPPLVRPRATGRWLWLVLVLFLVPFLAVGGLVLGVASFFHQSSDTRGLRKTLTQAGDTEWRQHIALNIGSVTLGLVRAGLSFAPLDPEARVALRTVRGVEVGIYELATGSKSPDRVAMLAAADRAMSSRGWERVVGVLDKGQMVGVYLPAQINSVHQVKACVVVSEGRQMVVVSARADLEPLQEFLRNQTDWRSKMRLLASQ